MLVEYFQKKQRFMFVLFFCLLLGSFMPSANASVRSLKAEEYVQHSDGEIYWEVNVNCTNSNTPRVIHKKSGADEWCSKDLADICGKAKMNAALKVCQLSFNMRLKGIQEAEQKKEADEIARKKDEQAKKDKKKAEAERLAKEKAEEEDPLRIEQNQIAIEDKRIKIDQQQLNLRRQELELRKQELELKLKLREKEGS